MIEPSQLIMAALGLPLLAIAAMGPYQESVVDAFRDAAAVA